MKFAGPLAQGVLNFVAALSVFIFEKNRPHTRRPKGHMPPFSPVDPRQQAYTEIGAHMCT